VVRRLGDVDGDGLEDLAVDGAPESERIYLLLGRSTVELSGEMGIWEATRGGWGVEIVKNPIRFQTDGFHVAAAGDADGDGLADVLVGNERGGEDRGIVHLIFGRREWPAAIELADDPPQSPGVTRILGAKVLSLAATCIRLRREAT
jgi:hypothetical protein